jgi:hypothetical protein
MVPAAADVKKSIKIRRLAAAGQHGRRASLQLCNLGRHIVVGGKTGIKVSVLLQIKQTSHLLTGFIFKSSTLNNRYLTGFSISRRITALYTYAVNIHSHTSMAASKKGCTRPLSGTGFNAFFLCKFIHCTVYTFMKKNSTGISSAYKNQQQTFPAKRNRASAQKHSSPGATLL